MEDIDPIATEKQRKREELMRNLDEALKLASELSIAAKKAFGTNDHEPINLDGLSIDQKIAMGNKAASDLYNIAFSIHPDKMLDHHEALLGSDVDSINATADVLKIVSRA